MAKLIVGFRNLANASKNVIELLKRLALTLLVGTYGVLLHVLPACRYFHLSGVPAIKLMRFVNMSAYFADCVLFLIILLVFVVEMFISSACFTIMFHAFAFFFVIGLAVIESFY